MSGAPEVTVVLPTRNRWPLAQQAIGCVLSQREVGLELIVIDDGSSDGTAAGLAALDDARLRVISHDPNRGVARSRNEGIAEARGTWVAFLDDDDLWAPERLRRSIDVAQAAGATFAYGARLSIDARREVVGATLPDPPEGLEERLLHRNGIGSPSCVIARADALRRVGGFDERLSALADWDLWLALAADGPAAACDELLVGYTEHDGNMHITDPVGFVAEFDLLEERHRARTGRPVSLDRVHLLRWVSYDLKAYGLDRQAAKMHLRLARARRRVTELGWALLAWAKGNRPRRPPERSPLVGPEWLAPYRSA